MFKIILICLVIVSMSVVAYAFIITQPVLICQFESLNVIYTIPELPNKTCIFESCLVNIGEILEAEHIVNSSI